LRRPLAFVGLACALIVGAALLWRSAFARRAVLPASTLSLLETLGAQKDDDRFEKALAPRAFSFPQDHGPHLGFRNEWWYWTGNLAARDGRRFGYQLTIFRSALGAVRPARASAWATNQAYMAHFTMTEIAGDGARGFHAFERLSRGAVGLAGAKGAEPGEPFSAWVLDWSATAEAASPRPFAVRLRAVDADVGIDLQLEQGKAAVLQGRDGLSQKGAAPGNASFYYSLTRMPTVGSVTSGGEEVHVEGSSWMDREWSTSALEEGQTGWDWFALQLDDGRELMFFRLRRVGGGFDEHSHGSIVDADGSVTQLRSRDVRIDTLDSWTSPASGTTYPSRFRLTVTAPSAAMEVEVAAARTDQELNLSFRYWEGAVVVRGRDLAAVGTAGGVARPVQGRGYVELTGYDGGLQNPR